MNPKVKLGLIISAGLLLVLILIGLIVLLIKFIMKRCRKKAWDDINTLPKQLDSSDNNINQRKLPKRTSSERQLLYQSSTNNATDISDGHISIPINENDTSHNYGQYESTKEHEHTIVDIQRDRLNHIKEEEKRIRPMIQISDGEDIIQRTIDQVQKEFDESI
ncbi:unnamed protein product [Rotaria sordida]|uniref:Uncharacterized protein n=1 Tax=Rotaria sordida TaxID=392033 RepID=A0A814VXL1_9BILA|nr:unnamed protein product [Rotaria sordida]CAF1194653.1 unnamed protein product [Rotaria sordida]CAF1202126.1 unnamed protein product [Rotaria sordida]CAF1291269.1 unnamed protein product [Rotaria sordida]CAF1463025.1 unnamed protein product [Rotaria sordida]